MTESINLSPELDPHSPYYIDPDFESIFNHHPVILSQAEDNYVSWKLHLHALLRLGKKIGFIDGTLEKPDPSSPLYKPWKQCDRMVKYWLMNSMTENVLNQVMFAKTAHQMWEDTRKIFVPNLDLKIYQVRQTIATLRQEGHSVETYYKKMSKAWMDLSAYDPVPNCACRGCKCEIKKRGDEARENEERYAFLIGLSESLSFMRPIIMVYKPPPSGYQAYLMLKEVESELKTDTKEHGRQVNR